MPLIGGNRFRTYIYSPEFFDGVKSDDFLEQIVPVIALEDSAWVSIIRDIQ